MGSQEPEVERRQRIQWSHLPLTGSGDLHGHHMSHAISLSVRAGRYTYIKPVACLSVTQSKHTIRARCAAVTDVHRTCYGYTSQQTEGKPHEAARCSFLNSHLRQGEHLHVSSCFSRGGGGMTAD